MSQIFDVNVLAISKRLDNIFSNEELEYSSAVSKMEIVQKERNRNVRRNLELYNLDAIIAVEYRVNSKKGTQFRIWVTNVLKEYISSMDEMLEQYLIENQKKSQ